MFTTQTATTGMLNAAEIRVLEKAATGAGLTTPFISAGATERRDAVFDEIELREQDEKLIFIGHAAVFDRLSDDLGGFHERIQRGAFRKVLDGNADVRFLFNHNPDLVLARTASKTMELREDPKGLRVYAELAPTTFAKDLRVLIKRGDVSGMSFGFRVLPEGKDVWEEVEGKMQRTILSFGELFDVGPVVFPAYAHTDASMRSLVCGIEVVNESGEVAEGRLREIAWKIHRGEVEATVEERSAIDAAFSKTGTVSPWIAQRALMATCQEPELQGAIQGKRVTVAIEDAPSGEPAFRLAARQRRLRLHTS